VTDFPNEVAHFVDGPREEALLLARGEARVVDPAATSPELRFGIATEDVVNRTGLSRIHGIARLSKTFRQWESRLKRAGIRVRREVDKLPDSTGGGRTAGGGTSYTIRIWPRIIWAGFHVLDVYVHEWGHIVEENGGESYQRFLNRVQGELGIRITRDTHALESPPPPPKGKRDPFQPPRGA